MLFLLSFYGLPNLFIDFLSPKHLHLSRFNQTKLYFQNCSDLIFLIKRKKFKLVQLFYKIVFLQKSHLNRAGNINLRPISTSGSMPKNLMASSASAAASEWQYEPTFRPGSMSRVQTSFAVVTNPATSHSQQHNVRIWSIPFQNSEWKKPWKCQKQKITQKTTG